MVVLEGKTIVVTGASRGIGAAIAEACVRRGARVYLNYIAARDEAEALAAKLTEKYEGEALTLQFDVGNPEAIEAAAAAPPKRIPTPVRVASTSPETPKAKRRPRAKVQRAKALRAKVQRVRLRSRLSKARALREVTTARPLREVPTVRHLREVVVALILSINRTNHEKYPQRRVPVRPLLRRR